MEKEGLVKYNLDHTITKISSSHVNLSEINEVRRILLEKKFLGTDDHGIGYGNISQRLEKESREFLITGTQTSKKKELEIDDFSIITDFNVDGFYLKSSGKTSPSSEAFSHAIIYKLFRDMNAVIHIHSEPLWLFMLQNNFLKTEDVGYGTKEMVAEIQRIYYGMDIREGSIFAMTGHHGGIIAFSQTLDGALSIIEACKG